MLAVCVPARLRVLRLHTSDSIRRSLTLEGEQFPVTGPVPDNDDAGDRVTSLP
jgi:hypothetical protein